MKVFINAVSAKSGGAATYIRNLVPELVKESPRDEYVLSVPTAQASPQSSSIEHQAGHVRVLETDIAHKPSWQRYLWDQLYLRQQAARESAELLISSSDFGVYLAPCKQILMVRNALFFSEYYAQHFLPHKTRRFQLEFALRRQLILASVRSADLVMTASHSMLNDLRRYTAVPDEKTWVNPFGVPLERFTAPDLDTFSQHQNQPQPFRLLYVSEYSDYKNLTTLLAGLVLLRQRGVDDFRLATTAGPDDFPGVEINSRQADRRLASELGPCLEPLGSLPYEDIPRVYRETDLFVFPSCVESFGHPLVEAMASGVPILASDIPICREVCSDAAVYFDPAKPADLAEKVLMLKQNPELRQQLRAIGRWRAQTHFDWKDHVQRLLQMMHQTSRGN